MPTSPATPKKAVSKAVKESVATKRPARPRKRAVTKVASKISDTEVVPARGQRQERPLGPRHIEQLALISLALLFGLVGFAVHVLWFVSIVLMAIQLGLLASEFGNRHGSKGIISEVTHEVVAVVEEIKSGPSDDDGSEAAPVSAATDPEIAPTA